MPKMEVVMDLEKRVRALEIAYAGVQADAVRCFDSEGVLDKVTEKKRKEQLLMGKHQAEVFNIQKAQDVFNRLSEIFNCATWTITEEEDGFTAVSEACKLCAMAKKVCKSSPCYMYCLNPMEGIIKGLNADNSFEVIETQWDGQRCIIKIKVAK